VISLYILYLNFLINKGELDLDRLTPEE